MEIKISDAARQIMLQRAAKGETFRIAKSGDGG